MGGRPLPIHSQGTADPYSVLSGDSRDLCLRKPFAELMKGNLGQRSALPHWVVGGIGTTPNKTADSEEATHQHRKSRMRAAGLPRTS